MRQKVNGGLKDKQAPVGSYMMKAVSQITALDVDAKGFSLTVGATDMGMHGLAVLVSAHKDGVVVFGVLVDQLLMRKGRYDAVVNSASLGQIRENPPHVRMVFGQHEGLGFLYGRR